MLVPGHVVSLYVATSGYNGAALGSDEKEVVLLIYVIIDVQTNNVSTTRDGDDDDDDGSTPAGADSPRFLICGSRGAGVAASAADPDDAMRRGFDSRLIH
ncbi:conserved hypothetical protein [Culex quinquefasciatus]|uniref:Uncharacterized protein n=1 Tax=Culex quinquefasciatus TaxID=7176 RepID=B0WRI9_CULQU|nr:conserved hypothetical protein [Culex quinquefasciatus]|eukprot:XP_001851323.1 conserved hypothetical protein [Culex quinquefasciatus]